MKHCSQSAVVTALMVSLGLMAAAGPSARAETPEGEAAEVRRPRGRDIVQSGELKQLQGTLSQAGGEWFLKVGEDEYELHMGNHEYRAKINIPLETGKEATVNGFVLEKDVAVTTILIDRQLYRFREDDGKPLWAGMAGGTGSGKEGGRGREDSGRERKGAGRGEGGGN